MELTEASRRKASIRDSVAIELDALKDLKRDAFESLGATPFERSWFAKGWLIEILWGIIDKLVDEIANIRPADKAVPECPNPKCPNPKCTGKDIGDYGPKMRPRYACHDCGNMFDAEDG